MPAESLLSCAEGSAAGQLQEKGAQNGTAEGAAAAVLYEEYDPLVLLQRQGQPVLEFPSFDAALDEFYSKVNLDAEHALATLRSFDRICDECKILIHIICCS